MSSPEVLICDICDARIRGRPSKLRRWPCPCCGSSKIAAGRTNASAPATITLQSLGQQAPITRPRSARLQGLREVALLLALTAVLTGTACFGWLGLTVPSDVAPPTAVADTSSRPSDPSSPRDAPADEPAHRLVMRPAAASSTTIEADGPDIPSIEPLSESPPPDSPDLPPEAEVPNDSPRQPIRSAPDVSIPPPSPTIPAPVPGAGAMAAVPLPGGPIPIPIAIPVAIAASSPPVSAPSPAEHRREPGQVLVSDPDGRVLVSRVYASRPDGLIVQLPDGSLGRIDEAVPTDRPFRPWPPSEVRDALLSGPYRGFEVIERSPYLIFFEGDPSFARRAAALLQQLYRDLTDCLDDGFDIHAPKFPLVVVIFRDEASFQRYRRVDPDVRAYYEIYSNRIVLYETSEQDRRAPELAALRRPQTIAHEGVHQILQNTGVQPRLAVWPSWLVEGLAEYYAPASVRTTFSPKHYGRNNFGQVNPFHMATLIDLQDPIALLDHLRGPGSDRIVPVWTGRSVRTPWLSYLLTRPELSPTDYALAWSLTHYLAHARPDAFRSYLTSMAARDPLEPRSPAQHLADFRAAFGPDLDALAVQINRHLASVPDVPHVPYYAVFFEQAMGFSPPRRGTLVTQSPSMMAQWLQALTAPDGGPMIWWAQPYRSHSLARRAADSWMLHH